MSVKILSAGKHQGKTTFLRAYLAQKAHQGRAIGGIVSPAVFENDQCVGYDLIDVRSGTRRPLARLFAFDQSCLAVGKYWLEVNAIKAGNAAIVSAVRERLDITAIDEVGPLEFRGQGWALALERALQEYAAERELVVVVRPSLVDKLPDRFPSPMWETASLVSPPWPTPEQI